MTYFRTCSTCGSRSQAPLCHCTLRPFPIGLREPSRASVNSFGGDRPSQTYPPDSVPDRMTGPGLDIQNNQGGISRTTPPTLGASFKCLPPIHTQAYSEGHVKL